MPCVDAPDSGGYGRAVAEPLKLYVKTWCPWCITAVKYLRQRGYGFKEIDVEASRADYAEMIKLSGQSYTPTLEIEGKVLADFGPDELEEFLRAERIEPQHHV